MLKRENFPVAKIYVPTERRKTRDQKRVDEIAESTARFVVNPVRFRTKYDELTGFLERLERNVPA